MGSIIFGESLHNLVIKDTLLTSNDQEISGHKTESFPVETQ